MKGETLFKGCMIMALLAMTSFAVPAVAGSLEPPASAVDGNGNPVPTTSVPPSWSQKLPAAERFELVLDGAGVLDKETGLVWEQVPDSVHRTWVAAKTFCITSMWGDRFGWRLPTVEELASLIDPTQPYPRLPSGNPFSNLTGGPYWSATLVDDTGSLARVVSFSTDSPSATIFGITTSNAYYAWCVRGGHGIGPR